MTAVLSTNFKELKKALEGAWYQSIDHEGFHLALEPEELDLLDIYFYAYSENNETIPEFARSVAKGDFKLR